MAKFSNLRKGARGYREIDFERPDGQVDKVRVRALLGARDDEIFRAAKEFATANGGNPVVGDVEFDRGIYLHTILLACEDVDSPLDKAEPYFPSLDTILDKDTGLDRDRIAYLFEVQQQVQDEFAPRPKKLTPLQYFEWMKATAEADDGVELPFERSPRPTQRAFVRGLAQTVWTSLQAKFSSGPPSRADEKSSESSASTSPNSNPPAPPANSP